jgi:hypothetical protein
MCAETIKTPASVHAILQNASNQLLLLLCDNRLLRLKSNDANEV